MDSTIDPHTLTREQLNTNLEARVCYMQHFLDFNLEDVEILRAVRPIAKPLIPEVVASVYDKLLSYDISRRAFLPRKDGSQGTHSLPEDLVRPDEALTIDSAAIKLRRNILEQWALKLFTADYAEIEIYEFFDRLGKQHTGGSRVFSKGKKRELFVDYIHLAMTLGYIQDALIGALLSLPESTWPLNRKTAAVRAFGKVVFLHNDLIARHRRISYPLPRNRVRLCLHRAPL